MHQQTVERLLRELPGTVISGFARDLKPILSKWHRYTIRPDLHRFDPGQKILMAIEVEDKNPISAKKMEVYCELWRDLQRQGWAFHLKVCGRWGDDLRDLDFVTRSATIESYRPPVPLPEGGLYQDELTGVALKMAILEGRPIRYRPSPHPSLGQTIEGR